jgi:hypothetical protein
MLGFAAGPSLMALARRSLPFGLGDSRCLRASVGRERLGLAGLVAAVEGRSLVLLDEFGTADVDLGQQEQLPSEGELVLADGTVEVRHRAASLKAQRVEAWHPGIGRAEQRKAA